MAFGIVGELHGFGLLPALLALPLAIWAFGIPFGTHMDIITILITAGIVSLTVFNALTGTPAKTVPTDI